MIIEAEVKMSRPDVDKAGQIEADDGSVRWTDSIPWRPSLPTQKVVFTLPTKRLTVKLGLTLAPRSHYVLRVGIVEKKHPEVMTIGSSERDNSVGHLESTAKQVSETSSPSGREQSERSKKQSLRSLLHFQSRRLRWLVGSTDREKHKTGIHEGDEVGEGGEDAATR